MLVIEGLLWAANDAKCGKKLLRTRNGCSSGLSEETVLLSSCHHVVHGHAQHFDVVLIVCPIAKPNSSSIGF